jgi:hypothetical protein
VAHAPSLLFPLLHQADHAARWHRCASHCPAPHAALCPCPQPTNPALCHPAPPRAPTVSPRPITRQMELKLKREGNEIDFDSNSVNGSRNQWLETKTLMVCIVGSRLTSSQLGAPIKWPSSIPAISFPPISKKRYRHSVSLHPDLARLVAKEEETPLPPLKDELNPEVHHMDPTTSPTLLVSASSLPAYTRPHQ